MGIELLDLIDKLNLDQKTINDLNKMNIFYVYELLVLDLNALNNISLFQRRNIQEACYNNNYNFMSELTDKKKKKYYEKLSFLLEEKKGRTIGNCKIDELRLSKRVELGLKRAGYFDLYSVSKLNIRKLENVRNLGESSIEILLNKLHSLGIYLHGEDIKYVKKIVSVDTEYEKVEKINDELLKNVNDQMVKQEEKKKAIIEFGKLKNLSEEIAKENRQLDNELIEYIYRLLDLLRNDDNEEEIKQIESILLKMYSIDETPKKLIKE